MRIYSSIAVVQQWNPKPQSNSSNVFLKSFHTLEEEEIPSLDKKLQVSLIVHPLRCFSGTAEVLTCVQLTAQAASGWIWKHAKAAVSEKPPATWHHIFPTLCKSITYQKHDKFKSSVLTAESTTIVIALMNMQRHFKKNVLMKICQWGNCYFTQL